MRTLRIAVRRKARCATTLSLSRSLPTAVRGQTAPTGGRGTVTGDSLEASNVDIATEFTNLIVLQSAYQANSKFVTVLDELTQSAIDILQV